MLKEFFNISVKEHIGNKPKYMYSSSDMYVLYVSQTIR